MSGSSGSMSSENETKKSQEELMTVNSGTTYWNIAEYFYYDTWDFSLDYSLNNEWNAADAVIT